MVVARVNEADRDMAADVARTPPVGRALTFATHLITDRGVRTASFRRALSRLGRDWRVGL